MCVRIPNIHASLTHTCPVSKAIQSVRMYVYTQPSYPLAISHAVLSCHSL